MTCASASNAAMDHLRAIAAAATWGLDLARPEEALRQARKFLAMLDHEAQRRREGRTAAKIRDITRDRASLQDAIRWLERVDA